MRTRARLPRTVWALGLVSLLTDLGSEMIVPLLLGAVWSAAGAGVAFATAAAAALLAVVALLVAVRPPRSAP